MRIAVTGFGGLATLLYNPICLQWIPLNGASPRGGAMSQAFRSKLSVSSSMGMKKSPLILLPMSHGLRRHRTPCGQGACKKTADFLCRIRYG